jgi:hypothetical protein
MHLDKREVCVFTLNIVICSCSIHFVSLASVSITFYASLNLYVTETFARACVRACVSCLTLTMNGIAAA